jgi:UDP:flavonoid glycosyltransferase YjiC (YdhE family)
MRVLLATTGHSGHVLPLVPFARACARAGHDVAVAFERSRAAGIERLGLPTLPFDDADDDAWAPFMATLPTLSQPAADALAIGTGFAGIGTASALPGVLETVATWRPDVVVHESYHYAGPLAAEYHGIPHARVALGLASTEDWVVDLAAAAVDEQRRGLGLPPDPTGARLRRSPLLTLVPPGLDDGPAHRFRGPASEPAGGRDPIPQHWAKPDDPLVYVTLGSVTASLPFFPGLYRDVLAALAPLPVRVLLTLGQDADPEQLGALPANAHVERWVAQDAVLPHAAAVVGHGGFGTTLGALAHGVPLVLLPLFAGDQWRNARRVDAVGAGILLEDGPRRGLEPPGPAVLAALGGAVRRVLEEPGQRDAARVLAGAMAALPPVDAAVDGLERIAGRELRQPSRAA